MANAEYECLVNKHGVPYRAGPRTSGQHLNVWDSWDVGPTTERIPSPAVCRCADCGQEWSEGAGPDDGYPTTCEAPC